MVRHGHRAPHYVSRDHYDHICVIEYNTRTSSGVYRKVFGCAINITINISTLLPRTERPITCVEIITITSA